MLQAEEKRPNAARLDLAAGQRIAVLVPCFNEEAAIAKVVADFRAALPEAPVYVYDNNSTDRTAEVARRAGAVVAREAHQGKGHVVRRMFADVDADVLVLVDGDATYDAASVRGLIAKLLDERLDMMRQSVAHLGNVRVDTSEGLVVDAADAFGVDFVVKGLRTPGDFEAGAVGVALFGAAITRVDAAVGKTP